MKAHAAKPLPAPALPAVALFALAATVLIGGAAFVLSLVYSTPEGRKAVWISAAIALVTQLVTFAIVRLSRDANWMAAWGLGMLLRFLVLAGYGLVILNTRFVPLDAALVTLAVAFFVTTLVEPVMLRKG